jgi:hypothetical protein
MAYSKWWIENGSHFEMKKYFLDAVLFNEKLLFTVRLG